MAKIGYARVSSKGQNLDRQIEELHKNNVERIFSDKLSGKDTRRPGLNQMLDFIRDGDVVIIVSLDRLSRNYNDIKDIISNIRNNGSSLLSLDLMTNSTGNKLIDTFTQDLMVSMLSFVAENERTKIRERQRKGIELAKKRGVYKGRPKKYTNGNQQLKKAVSMYLDRDNNKMTVDEIARLNGVSRIAIYRNKNMFN